MSREEVMERSLEKFIEDQNIARYAERLKAERDPLKRKVLFELLAKEEVSQANHSEPEQKNVPR